MSGGVIGSGSVSVIIEQGGMVYAGGSFTNMGGVTARNVAVWNGAIWAPLASGLNNTVSALALHGGVLYAGGTFTRRGDNTGSFFGIAKWDGFDWATVPGITFGRINNSVSVLATDGADLYAGGNFLFGSFDGSATNIARFDGANWSALGTELNATVSALAVGDGGLYAGGSFTSSGAQTLNRIARWNGSAWAPLGDGFESGSVSALAVSGTVVYAGGSFTNSGNTSLSRIARWNGSQWSPLGSGVARTPGSASISDIAIQGDDIYIAGNFTEAGGKASSYIGRWNEHLFFGPPPPARLLSPQWLPGQFRFEVSGVRSGTYAVEASTNLIHWQEISSSDVNNTSVIDSAPPVNQRYYRVRQP
jgi:trimeric autotransporter adhesin